jgi:hypothetical protein
MASRFAPLADHLRRQGVPRRTVSFGEIEAPVGALPASSRRWRAWWANDRSHVQVKDGWLAVDWQVESVDQDRGTVTFRR